MLKQSILFFSLLLSFVSISQVDSLECAALYKAEKMEDAYACYSSNEPSSSFDLYMCAMLSQHLKKEKEFKKWSKLMTHKKNRNKDAYWYKSYLFPSDSEKYFSVLSEGLKHYPDDTTLLTLQLNYFIANQEYKNALNSINELLEQQASKTLLIYTKGSILLELKRDNEAIEQYEKVLAIDYKHYDANYNMGTIYYNQAADLIDKANATVDSDEYNKLSNEASSKMKKAIPYLEHAFIQNTEEEVIKKALRTCYLKLEMMDKYRYILDYSK